MAHAFLTRITKPDDNGWAFARIAIGNFGDSDEVQIEITFGHEAATDVEGLFATWDVGFYLTPEELAQSHQKLLAYNHQEDEEILELGSHQIGFTMDGDELCLAVAPEAQRDVCLLREANAPAQAMLSGCIISVAGVLEIFQTAQFLLAANPTPQVFT